MQLIASFYQIIGFDFIEQSFFSVFGISRKVLVRIVFLLHLSFILLNLKYQYNFHLLLFEHPDVVGSITNLVEMILPILCHFVIVAESFCKSRKEEKIKRTMFTIRSTLHHDQSMVANYPILKFIFLVVVNSLIYIAVIMMLSDSHGKCFQS